MKKIITFFFIFNLAYCPVFIGDNFCTAQSVMKVAWQKTIGGDTAETFCRIRPTADGGYVLGGNSYSGISGDKTDGHFGFSNCYNYWVVKLDASGNIQWQNDIGAIYDDELSDLQQTTDGGYILGGTSVSPISGDKTENSQGYDDYWIIKLDAAGNIQWQNTIGGNMDDICKSIIQTSDGGYLAGGYSYSSVSGDKTESCWGWYDYWIVKLDSTGAIQWQKDIGANDADVLNMVRQTSDGGYILGGTSNSDIYGDKSEHSIGSMTYNDFWVVKVDSLGTIQWENTIGGNNPDELHSVEETDDGGYFLAGSSNSDISGDKTENCIGPNQDDFWIVKLDSAGVVQWDNTIGAHNWDRLYSAQQTFDGGYILGGDSWSYAAVDKTENSKGALDYWIVRIDPSGNIIWQKTLGGSGYEWFGNVQQMPDTSFIAGGISRSPVSGDKSGECRGDYDYWIMKFTENINVIGGKAYLDINSNLNQDANEPPLFSHLVSESTTGKISFTDANGNYRIYVDAKGGFTTIPKSLNYFSPNPASHSAFFTDYNQADLLNDFAFQPINLFNDLCIDITPTGIFRAGFNPVYIINYENAGTTILSPTVIFFPDNDVTFTSSNPVANSVTPDSVVWNFGSLAPYQSGSISVTVHVNNTVPNGTLINSSARIEPVAGDVNTACNYAAWEVYTVGSFDPNAIVVNEDSVLTTQLSNPPYLEYIIYFQNTGTAPAINIRVLNNIPQKLDLGNFEFVSSSHSINNVFEDHSRLMTFVFDNINLPDSNINEPASHGFIRYRIKPLSTLAAGDSIKNNAAIYFDFNQPVLTDTAVTEIVLPTGVSSQWSVISGQLAVYPNPAREALTINSYLITGKKAEMKIYDLYGREVFQLQTANF
ncbi:MAG TPA: hypothetical protein VJY62_13760, partial [Bacteroidia bacterium]|nr:hypothetical protein [Bacteroidia bacterium]